MSENAVNTKEQDFISRRGNSFAIYQLKEGREYHMLRFASLTELQKEAQRLRSDVHKIVTETEDSVFHNKAEAEQHLRNAGFTVIPDPDPQFITVRNPMLQEAVIYLTHGNDCCWIDGCDTRQVDHPVRKDCYDLVYAGALPGIGSQDNPAVLEDIYARFNLNRPEDFHGHSLSVSDVVVLNRDGQVRSYYTDSFGFKELPDFLSADNPLRNAEMALEDDYGMIDGIINNGPKPEKEPKDLTALINSDKKLPAGPRKSKFEPEL